MPALSFGHFLPLGRPVHPHPDPLPSRERGNHRLSRHFWIPACAGMTWVGIPRSRRCACSRPFRLAKGAGRLNGVAYGAVGSHRDHVEVAGFVGGFGYFEEVFVDFQTDAGGVG